LPSREKRRQVEHHNFVSTLSGGTCPIPPNFSNRKNSKQIPNVNFFYSPTTSHPILECNAMLYFLHLIPPPLVRRQIHQDQSSKATGEANPQHPSDIRHNESKESKPDPSHSPTHFVHASPPDNEKASQIQIALEDHFYKKPKTASHDKGNECNQERKRGVA